jgi:hypothetical protein
VLRSASPDDPLISMSRGNRQQPAGCSVAAGPGPTSGILHRHTHQVKRETGGRVAPRSHRGWDGVPGPAELPPPARSPPAASSPLDTAEAAASQRSLGLTPKPASPAGGAKRRAIRGSGCGRGAALRELDSGEHLLNLMPVGIPYRDTGPTRCPVRRRLFVSSSAMGRAASGVKVHNHVADDQPGFDQVSE